MSHYLAAGRFVSLHGVRGELKIYPYCDSVEMLVGFKRLYSDSNGTKDVEISRIRAANNMVIIKLKGIDTVEAARKYIDKLIYFNKDDVILDEGVHFIDDLLGCSIVDEITKRVYGKLTDVTSNGAQDIYHITMDSDEIRYIPAVPEFVSSIDIESKIIKIRPIPGMLED